MTTLHQYEAALDELKQRQTWVSEAMVALAEKGAIVPIDGLQHRGAFAWEVNEALSRDTVDALLVNGLERKIMAYLRSREALCRAPRQTDV